MGKNFICKHGQKFCTECLDQKLSQKKMVKIWPKHFDKTFGKKSGSIFGTV